MSFHFVDGGGQFGLRSLETRERRLIRRHVMMGKNRNKTRRHENARTESREEGRQDRTSPKIRRPSSHVRGASSHPGPQPSRSIGNQLQYFDVPFGLKPYMQRAIYSCQHPFSTRPSRNARD